MPFITEEIYHLLAKRTDDLCVLPYPALRTAESAVLSEARLLKEAITALRDARVKAQLKPKEPIKVFIQTRMLKPPIVAISRLLARQINAQSIEFTREPIPAPLRSFAGKDKFYIVARSKRWIAVTNKGRTAKRTDLSQGFPRIRQ